MILVDTSVWIDHLHSAEGRLVAELEAGQVATHALVVTELAVGNISGRAYFLEQLRGLPMLATSRHEEVLELVDRHVLHGVGLGAVDAHLLTALALAPGVRLWTHDKRLKESAVRLSLPIL